MNETNQESVEPKPKASCHSEVVIPQDISVGAEQPCKWCEQGLRADFLDEDGTRCSITLQAGILSHAWDDAWWPCLRRGEIRCEIAATVKADQPAWQPTGKRFYEIICESGVVGLTGGDYDELLHVAQEDNVLAFGEISEQDFNRYGDNWWTEPISTIRWRPIVRTVLELEPLPYPPTQATESSEASSNPDDPPASSCPHLHQDFQGRVNETVYNKCLDCGASLPESESCSESEIAGCAYCDGYNLAVCAECFKKPQERAAARDREIAELRQRAEKAEHSEQDRRAAHGILIEDVRRLASLIYEPSHRNAAAGKTQDECLGYIRRELEYAKELRTQLAAAETRVNKMHAELLERIVTLRSVVIESGNDKDRAYLDGSIAALSNLADDLLDAQPTSEEGE